MRILIIGGSRFVGPLLIKKLVDNKHQVTVFNRGQIQTKYPDSVTFIKGDRDGGFKIDQHFDVVIDTCAYNGKQTQTALDQLSYDFFVHFGTVASYQVTNVFPLTEESPTGYWAFMGEYGKGKVECEQVLAASGKKYATLRPNYILGAANYCDRENFIYTRINAGEPLVLPGNGQALCQFVFAQDVAAALVLLAEQKAEGAFNCSGDEMVTIEGLVKMMVKLVEKEPVIKFNPAADRENHDEAEFPFANENMVCDNQKLKDLGFSYTPLQQGLKDDFESYYSKLLK